MTSLLPRALILLVTKLGDDKFNWLHSAGDKLIVYIQNCLLNQENKNAALFSLQILPGAYR